MRQWRQNVLYPKSDVFLDPGWKSRPVWEAYIEPTTSVGPELILVDLANVPGNVSRLPPLSCLSPIIQMHHEVNEFRVTWNVLYPGYDVNFNLKYNRATGEVVETQLSNDYYKTTAKVIGTNITDRDIHAGAAHGMEYTQWALQNWDR